MYNGVYTLHILRMKPWAIHTRVVYVVYIVHTIRINSQRNVCKLRKKKFHTLSQPPHTNEVKKKIGRKRGKS